jgi:hypothetical protein
MTQFKSNIESEWDDIRVITSDIAEYIRRAEEVGGEDLSIDIIAAIIKGVKQSTEK